MADPGAENPSGDGTALQYDPDSDGDNDCHCSCTACAQGSHAQCDCPGCVAAGSCSECPTCNPEEAKETMPSESTNPGAPSSLTLSQVGSVADGPLHPGPTPSAGQLLPDGAGAAMRARQSGTSDKAWSDVDKSELPRACFLVADGDARSDWKLPIYEGAGSKDADGHYTKRGALNLGALRAARSAVEGGRTGTPMSVSKAVKDHLEALAKKYLPNSSAQEDMPRNPGVPINAPIPPQDVSSPTLKSPSEPLAPGSAGAFGQPAEGPDGRMVVPSLHGAPPGAGGMQAFGVPSNAAPYSGSTAIAKEFPLDGDGVSIAPQRPGSWPSSIAKQRAGEDGDGAMTNYGGGVSAQERAVKGRAAMSASLASPDVRGRVWDAQAIVSGVSANGLNWLPDTLRRDASALEGIPVAVSWEPLDHHDNVGIFRGAEAVELQDGRTAIRGRVEIHDELAAERLLREYRRGQPYELSIDTGIKAERAREGGRDVANVLAIRNDPEKPTELTIVRRAAAGGKFMRAVASANQKESKSMTATVDPAVEARLRAAEEAEQRARESEERVARSLKAAEERARKAETMAAEVERRAQESAFREQVQRALESSRLPFDSRERVLQAIAPRDGGCKVLDKKGIDAAIANERAYVARIAESLGLGKVTGLGEADVAIGTEPIDRYQAAMDGFFSGEDEPLRASSPTPRRFQKGVPLGLWRQAKESFEKARFAVPEKDRVPRFQSFRQACEIVENGGRRMTPRDVLQRCFGWQPEEVRATESWARARESLNVSSFSLILGDSIRRMLLQDTALSDKMAMVRRIASSIMNVPDFRSNHRMQLGGYGLLNSVAEGGTYPTLTSPTNQESTYSVSKYGGIESITFEMIADDDVGVISKIPQRLKAAAEETLFQTIFNVIENNSTIPVDSQALFGAARGGTGNAITNKTASAFGATTLATARAAMRQQSPYGDSTKVIGAPNSPKLAFVPSGSEDIATRLGQATVKVQDANFNAIETPNIHYGLEPWVVDYWSSSTKACVVADPLGPGINTVEIGFLGGKQEPELLVADQPNVGSTFTADQIQFKIRFIFGYAFLDPRHFYGFGF